MSDLSGLLRLSNYHFNPYIIPFLLAAFLTIFVGGYVFVHGGRKQRAGFAWLCALIFLWLFSTLLVYSCRYQEQAMPYILFAYVGIAFIPPALYSYVSVWLGRGRANRTMIFAGNALAVAFLLAIFFTRTIVEGVTRYSWGYHSRLSILGMILFLPFFFGHVVLFFKTLIDGYRRETDVHVKKQILLVTFAFVIAFFGTVDFYPSVGIALFPIGGLILFLAFCVLSYTIVRYKLFDIETVIHRTLMWLLTTAVAIVPFAAFIYWTQSLRDPSSAWGSTFYYIAVAIAFYFYFRSIQPRLDHLFRRQRRNLIVVFEAFSRELVLLKNLRDLLQSFARMLRRQLYVRRLSVFLFDEKSDTYVPAIAKGLHLLKPFRLSPAFQAWLEKKDSVMMGDLVVSDPEVEPFKNEIEAFFRMTQGLVVVPFVLGGKLIGLASLGRKANLKRYQLSEVQFLAQLKVPVTIAFSNSMRFENINELYTQVRNMSDELKLWNVELEYRVQDRTRELVKTQEQLTQVEKLATLGTLAGGVAHEINNPLTAVLTNAQILLMSARKEDVESISLIEEGAKRCQSIVQKLMKYARKTAEEAPHRDVNLSEVVKGTCALMGFQLQQENIAVEMKLADTPPVKGIAGELDQVLTNLLVNAKDAIQAHSQSKNSEVNGSGPGNLQSKEDGPNTNQFPPRGNWGNPDCHNGKENKSQDRVQGQAAKVKGKILVETRLSTNAVEMVVKDNGIGISHEHQKKIFDPFFTTKDVGSGTGLGLSVSFGILKRHNASITVESSPGKGAIFTVRFPLQGL